MSDLLPVRPQPMSPAEPGYAPYAPMDTYAAAPGSNSRIRRYLTFLAKLWWVPLLTLLLGVGAGGFYILQMPPSYSSVARLFEAEKLNLPGGAAFSEDAQNRLGTETELLRAPKIEELARESLRRSSTNATIPRDKDGNLLSVRIDAGQAPRSTVTIVKATCQDPKYVQAYLNALVNEYQVYKKEVRKIVSGDTLNSIAIQVQRLETELKSYQEALTSFEKTNNLAILQEDARIAGGYLAQLKTRLSDLKLEEQLLDATAAEQESSPKGKTNSNSFLADALRNSANLGSTTIGSDRQIAFNELELLKIQREKFVKTLRPKHPKMLKLNADIERGEKLLELYRTQNRDQIAASRQAVRMRIENVENSVKDWESKVVIANALVAEADRLKFNVSRSQGFYDRLQSMLQNVDISRNINQESSIILDYASPAVRSFSDEKRILVTAVAGSLLLGLAIVLLVELRDDRFNSLHEVTEKITDNIMGQVPEIAVKRNQPLPLLGHGEDDHMYAESYRSLRSALLFLPLENGDRPKVILITSAIPNEGKSTVAANLAKTLALGGARVLLIDADLRKGHLHDMLGLNREPGITEFLSGSSDPIAIVQTNSVTNLSFVARGASRQGNPGDLLLGANFEKALAQWRAEFDHIIIDTCPVFAADDATTLAPKVDGTLIVVRNRFSRARAVREAMDHLYQRQARVLGVIYNRAHVSEKSYYYYKYGEYGADPDKKGQETEDQKTSKH